ncbi:hypothetical protein PHISCL_03442 [Aspergillus sclerotialis]|uniref:Uncharacterized protein n=1 Tax=Aspergillus sclerotialis TaxID=2070753 RepID=A0A3A2ZM77_9EURO|nr:hypothetical protein PHISCL_03442 [Aspergillus sclerotialis]
MARPLNPFRKQEPAKPLHSRWGDVSITVPTEGSWSQYNNPSGRHRKADYGPGYVPDCTSSSAHRPRHSHHHKHHKPPSSTTSILSEESTSPMDSASSHRSSSITATLNPRRLSMRLSPRPRTPSAQHHYNEEKSRLITTPRNDFAYKPIKVDYPAEVAETQASQLHSHVHGENQVKRANSTSSSRSGRFKYIPATVRYREELGEISTRSRSREPGGAGRKKDRRECRHDDRDYKRKRSYIESGNTGKKKLGSGGRASRISQSAGKYLTTDMVPDPDEIYE